MAFPATPTTNTSGEAAATQSHTVSLPSGLASGDLCLVLFGLDAGGAPEVSWPVGWQNEIKDASDATAAVTGAVSWRKCDGGEGASITVTSTTSAQSAHVTYRITGHDSDTNAPEISTGNSGDAQLQTPDSLSPSWGAEDTLWIAMTVADGSSGSGPWTVTGAPANYTDLINSESGGAGDGVTVGSAERAVNAVSEDPGNFTVGDAGGKEYIAFTVGVYPSSGLSIAVTPTDSAYQVQGVKVG